MEQHKTLRDTRLKYGADSEEYKEVALNIQVKQTAELKEADVFLVSDGYNNRNEKKLIHLRRKSWEDY